jgi:hypothetical protein
MKPLFSRRIQRLRYEGLTNPHFIDMVIGS